MRELLEQLVYKLETQRLLLAAGKTRWLPFAEAELAAVVAAVTEVELAREHASGRVAAELGLPSSTRLEELIDHLDPRWSEVLRGHRMHLLSLYAQAEDASHGNRETAARGLAQTREVIASLADDGVDVYDPEGHASSITLSARRLDRMV